MLPLQEEIPEMGTSRETPRFLAGKLVTIRRTIEGGLSQEELGSVYIVSATKQVR
jgi:hypothetical protein